MYNINHFLTNRWLGGTYYPKAILFNWGKIVTTMGELSNEEKSKEKAVKGSVVFVSDFVHISGELEVLARKLAYDHAAWLAPIAVETASAESREAKIRVGSNALIAKSVDVILAEPRMRPNMVVIPMTWSPTGASKLFPSLDADLELSSLGDGVCRLAITGRYKIPFGVIGEVANTAFMHRVAEDTIRRFLTQISEKLVA